MQHVRWVVRTEDRPRMTMDVLAVFAAAGLNITAMDVTAHHIFISFGADQAVLSALRQQVQLVPGVRAVEPAPGRVMTMRTRADVTFEDVIHVSPAMQRLVALAKQAARSDVPILLLGESGTGKDLLARAIHTASVRAQHRFVPVNCAALPEALVESELFGYEAGAFTGAQSGGRPGMMEHAHQGTLFLDEIGDLPLHHQAKLLRVLQEGRIRRVGARDEIAVDFRLIAATNRDLGRFTQEGQFRTDLYYRISVFPLVIPPLRERLEDLDVMVDSLLENWGRALGSVRPSVTPEAFARLRRYEWPGNVRELQNVLERALMLAQAEPIAPEHLLLGAMGRPTKGRPVVEAAPLSPASLRERVGAEERQALAEALARSGSVRKAARLLGISHTTFLNKMRRHGLAGAPEEEVR
ncbi:MAG TPA: sigma 54-interacting transcriptional regulator [Symbiobacteriaceae bacterium]|nr:sigma 54-interacting transcriptional regulator [Symbiobacteriaceae bacterium]